jgi:hypothetical protein
MSTGRVVLWIVAALLAPLLLFGAALLADHIRDRRGMAPLPPQFVSLLVIVATLLFWLSLCISAALELLR